MKIKSILSIFLILSVVSFFMNSGFYDYKKRGNDFLKNSKKFEKENNLVLVGNGVNTDKTIDTPKRNSIHQFEVMFSSSEELNLKQARKKLTISVNRYLKEINENKKLRKYLCDYPFTNNNLFYSIFFYDKTGNLRFENNIHSCVLDGDKIYYEIAHSDGTYSFAHEETYEEALEIVKSEKSD
ncbi:MAG: hypothetical protein K1060chlam1_01156 [Candidatus Anoxychlamydiales bacterium]|nr:hypothetical protein [Candidatus Anoxychlamydiales bacterium]